MARKGRKAQAATDSNASRTTWKRSEPIRIWFTPGEAADVDVFARAWEESASQVCWWIVTEYMQRHRRRTLQSLPYGIKDKALIKKLEALGGIDGFEDDGTAATGEQQGEAGEE